MTTHSRTNRSRSARPTTSRRPTPEVPPITAHTIPLFDRTALGSRVSGFSVHIADTSDPDGGVTYYGVSPNPIAEVEDEGENRRRAWHQRMLACPNEGMRSLIAPTEAMIDTVASLKGKAPHFTEVLDWIIRAMKLAMMTGTPLRLSPCLIVGPPGIGKTWLMRQLAHALAIPSLFIAMNTLADRGSALTGLPLVWRSAGPGKIARQLIDGATASPIVLLDEIDKLSPLNPAETPIESLHTFLEPENAKAFIDEFIDVPIDASHILWFASANDPSRLPASIRDRFVIFTITMDEGQRRLIAREIFATANAAFGYRFALETQDLLESALDVSPRQAGRLWTMAFGFAAESAREIVTRRDILAAAALIEERAPAIGFIANRQRMN